VFKFVPILNPDGVAHGHYRTDTLGQNLNRCYGHPDPIKQPTIYGVLKVLQHWHAEKRLFFYLDLHAHANKRGVFIYGNHLLDVAKHTQNVLYPKVRMMLVLLLVLLLVPVLLLLLLVVLRLLVLTFLLL